MELSGACQSLVCSVVHLNDVGVDMIGEVMNNEISPTIVHPLVK